MIRRQWVWWMPCRWCLVSGWCGVRAEGWSFRLRIRESVARGIGLARDALGIIDLTGFGGTSGLRELHQNDHWMQGRLEKYEEAFENGHGTR